MIINEYYNFYTNEVSKQVADELIARMDALSALNRNVSEYGSSKQFFAVRDKNTAKPELLRKFQEWQYRKVAYAEVRAFRQVSQCCFGQLVKEKEEAPFLVTIQYDNENGTVPGTGDNKSQEYESYGDIKYSVSNGLNRPSLYKKQPQVFLQSVSVTNEGYAGVVQRVVLKMRVFTREAFEIVDKWFLRPGNEMLVRFGWSVPLTSMETSSDIIHAIIFNFNATLADDTGWIITVHGIAKGNLAVGLALGSSAEETAAIINNSTTSQTFDPNVIPNLTTILKNEVNRIQTGFPGLKNSDLTNIYDGSTDLDSDNKPYGIVYDSDVFPHGIGRIKFAINGSPTSLSLPSQLQNGNLNIAVENREASDAELDAWLEGFRKANPTFTELENKPDYGKKSAKAFIEFYRGNFGLVETGIFSDTMWPQRSDVIKTEEFINGRNPNQTELTQQERDAGVINRKELFYKTAADAAVSRTADINVATQVERNNTYAKQRPPFGPLRRKILNIMYKELPDNRTEEQKNLERERDAMQARVESPTIPQDVQTRITDPQSSAKYYICLGDLVYFFNEKVLKKAPELYEAVQLLVENQPTSYDGNVVSCLPHEVMLSNARNTQGGMSAYGANNSINYGFKYKKSASTNELVTAFGCDGVDFYTGSFFNSKEDMQYHREDWGLYLRENGGQKIAAFNIAHIWISVDVISELYTFVLKDKAIDPQYQTVFDFFEQVFGKIAQATAGITRLTLIPDQNKLYTDRNLYSGELSLNNPLLKKTQLFRIVDTNFQVPHNLPGAPRSFDFKINDVNATLVRDVDVALKLPSKLQTVAYTYGRVGMSDEIVDVDEGPDSVNGICNRDNELLVQKRQDTYNKLYGAKYDVSTNLSPDNIEKLTNALGQYAINPIPYTSTADDTIHTVANHQGWIYSKLYPVELKIKIDGIAGFLYGNKINVLNALPSRYSDRVYFTLTKIEHEIQNNDWVTTLTGIARLKNSNGLLQFPQVISREGRPDLCDKVQKPSSEPALPDTTINFNTATNFNTSTQINTLGSGGGTFTIQNNTSIP